MVLKFVAVERLMGVPAVGKDVKDGKRYHRVQI